MRLSYNWLKEYVDLSGITPEVLGDRMTLAGLEVEGIDYLSRGSNLVIGKVLTCEPHPDSDHLHVTTVDVGDKVLPIVCGAPNIASGQKVIVAQIGAVLPEVTIKAGNIRGQLSEGMICSLLELGVDKKQLTEAQQQGIEVLPEDAPVGNNDPRGYLGLDDVILDVSLTPNRSDCLSMWAMAREVGAILDRPVHIPDAEGAAKEGKATTLQVSSTTEGCKRFAGKVIGKLTIKESPAWMKKALAGAGVKSINNVVDISNYVMLETGQPLHFYDLAKIPLREITVVDGLKEGYTALDGIEYAIQPEDLMITTGKKAIGIAGIMGGDDSKIEDNTTGIIIEAAAFDVAKIRISSRRLNLMTEASLHFQKGIEPLAPLKAMDRSVQLLKELADAAELEETVLYGDFDLPPVTIDTSVDYLNQFLSTNFTEEEIVTVLKRLNLNPEVQSGKIHVTVPSYRPDLRLPVDLSEEVVRLLGYDTVPLTFPAIYDHPGKLAEHEAERYQLRNLLVAKGYAETITYSLVSGKMIQNAVLPCGEAVALSNPLSEERHYFRTSILASQLDVIAYNKARSSEEWAIFEIANVSAQGGIQKEHLAISISAKTMDNEWKHVTKQNDFYTMKGLVTGLLNSLGYDSKRLSFELPKENIPLLHPYQSAILTMDRKKIGVLGAIHPQTVKELGIGATVSAELDLSLIHEAKTARVKYNPTPKYPSVKYDIALIVDDAVSAGDLVASIRKQGGKLVNDVRVFDLYKGLPLLPEQKSVAVTIVYQSMEKTLTDQDIQPIQTTILQTLKKQFNAQLRES